VWRHPLDQRRLGAQCPRHGRGHAGAVPYSTGRSGHGGSAPLRGAGAGGEPGSASLGARPSGAQGAGGEPGCAALRGAGAGGGEPNGGVPLARTRARRSRALHNVCAQRAAANRTAGCPRHGRGHAGAGPYITSARSGRRRTERRRAPGTDAGTPEPGPTYRLRAAGGGEPNGGVPLARTRARRSRALHATRDEAGVVERVPLGVRLHASARTLKHRATRAKPADAGYRISFMCCPCVG